MIEPAGESVIPIGQRDIGKALHVLFDGEQLITLNQIASENRIARLKEAADFGRQ